MKEAFEIARLIRKSLRGELSGQEEKILSDWDENKLPNIRYYIDCGDKDGLLEGNFQVHQIMRQKNIKHEFRVHGGGHSWTYWRTALPEVLKFVSQTFCRS